MDPSFSTSYRGSQPACSFFSFFLLSFEWERFFFLLLLSLHHLLFFFLFLQNRSPRLTLSISPRPAATGWGELCLLSIWRIDILCSLGNAILSAFNQWSNRIPRDFFWPSSSSSAPTTLGMGGGSFMLYTVKLSYVRRKEEEGIRDRWSAVK